MSVVGAEVNPPTLEPYTMNHYLKVAAIAIVAVAIAKRVPVLSSLI